MKMTLIVVFGVISLLMLAMGVSEFYMQWRLLSGARPVQATITAADVFEVRDLTGDDAGGITSYIYEPRVKFTYEIDGTSYEGTMMRPIKTPRNYPTAGHAETELVAFPVGAKVQAFVSPNYPDKAYLIKETSRAPVIYMLIGVGVPLFIFALIKVAKL